MYSRPSIDITMQSASEVYRDKLLAILFSCANQDGANGMLKIKNLGGETVVHNPIETEVNSMPLAAISINTATKTLNIIEIENLSLRLAS